jgi:hypothetical protein
MRLTLFLTPKPFVFAVLYDDAGLRAKAGGEPSRKAAPVRIAAS